MGIDDRLYHLDDLLDLVWLDNEQCLTITAADSTSGRDIGQGVRRGSAAVIVMTLTLENIGFSNDSFKSLKEFFLLLLLLLVGQRTFPFLTAARSGHAIRQVMSVMRMIVGVVVWRRRDGLSTQNKAHRQGG